MRALGLVTDKQISSAVSEDPEILRELIPTLEEAAPLYVVNDPEKTIENALDYIGKRVAVGQKREYRITRAQQVLDRYLLPHIGTNPEDRIKKAYYLGQMAQKLLELVLDRRKPDDKDHYANKRLKLAGDLLTSQFRVAFHNLCRDIKYQLERTTVRGRKPHIRTAVRADVITERLRHALATGNWTGGKAGVSQLLDRTNYMSALSHLRRVVSPLSRSQPHFEARDLHPTHWGKICPNETPEGPNCGLVKNLALMAHISVGVDENTIERLLYDLGVQPIEEVRGNPRQRGARVFLNGKLLGIHVQPEIFVTKLRQMRRRGEVSSEVNVAYYSDVNEVLGDL
jgi:DNA-directed RNA polymerase subunit B